MKEKERVEEEMARLVSNGRAHNTLSFELADQILSIPSLAILSDDQSLPEMPDFQYDEEEHRPYLKRGAINYSKLLANFKRVI